MKKILLVGNGAREHVIAETLKRSPQDVKLYAFGKATNPGILELAEEYQVGSLSDFTELKAFAAKIKPDFAIIGPDDPIADGAGDALLEYDIHCASPLSIVARLESSKSFTRDLVAKYEIPGNPKFQVFYEENGILDFLRELGDDYVVKADGLAGGKGVKVAGDHLHSHDDAMEFAREAISKHGRAIVEEKLVGPEFSLMSFADGKNIVDMPAVQDHKRAYDGDKGPNTGGMGSYSDADHSLPFLKPEHIKEAHNITQKTCEALFKETGVLFKGIMYGGFMVTKNGVRLIEYNARFGDPEAMNVLPILKTDFVEVCEAIINGTLDRINIEFEKKATVCKYVVPEGYPDNPVKGEKIEIGEVPEGVKMYYSSVDKREDGVYMSGSRALAFVGIADSLDEAEKIAASALGCVSGPVFYRNDIGTKELIKQRIDMVDEMFG